MFAESLAAKLEEFWKTNAPIILQVTNYFFNHFKKKFVVYVRYIYKYAVMRGLEMIIDTKKKNN